MGAVVPTGGVPECRCRAAWCSELPSVSTDEERTKRKSEDQRREDQYVRGARRGVRRQAGHLIGARRIGVESLHNEPRDVREETHAERLRGGSPHRHSLPPGSLQTTLPAVWRDLARLALMLLASTAREWSIQPRCIAASGQSCCLGAL